MHATSAATEPPLPWWRFGIMWLVLGLPAAVVCASLVMAGIAWRHADRVLTDPPPRQGLEPAVSARNHAATPAR